jgi:hypothetical protein
MPHGIQITFDAADPPRLAEFWALALGYVLQPPPPGFESWEAFAEANDMPGSVNDYGSAIDPEGIGPRLFFQKVPEPKTAKNRVHLDVHASGDDGDEALREAHIQKLVEAGATRHDQHTEFGATWVVMSDPEGNEFCVS